MIRIASSENISRHLYDKYHECHVVNTDVDAGCVQLCIRPAKPPGKHRELKQQHK